MPTKKTDSGKDRETHTLTVKNKLRFQPLCFLDLLAIELLRPDLPQGRTLKKSDYQKMISRFEKLRADLADAYDGNPDDQKLYRSVTIRARGMREPSKRASRG